MIHLAPLIDKDEVLNIEAGFWAHWYVAYDISWYRWLLVYDSSNSTADDTNDFQMVWVGIYH